MSNKLCAERNNDNWYIAFNDGTGIEWCYYFRKCMHNELFTFYRVGFRTVNRDYSDTNGISNLASITWLNKTGYYDNNNFFGSDNIGPIGINGYKFVGGNHYWLDNNTTKTAICNSFSIKFDDTYITTNIKTLCNKVTVIVNNTIFDPSVEQPSDTPPSILSTPLAEEQVTYVISKNSIEVAVNHEFIGGVGLNIDKYYGMQSMFNQEDAIFIIGIANVNGDYGFCEPSSRSINKSEYPSFNRFVEKNDNGYQSSYLKPIGIGNHSMLTDSSIIFLREGSKCYHSLIFKKYGNGQYLEITNGMQYSWSGVYTWFKQSNINSLPVDDDDLLVYSGVINDRDVLYIDAKKSCNRTVQLPNGFDRGRINYFQIDNNMEITLSGNQIVIGATDRASSIIYSRKPGDVNDDGIVDITDVNAAMQMILRNQDVDLIADMNGDDIIDVEDIDIMIQMILHNNN